MQQYFFKRVTKFLKKLINLKTHCRSIFNSANISMEQGNSWNHRCKMNGFDYVQRIDMKDWLVSTLLLSIGPNETG